MEFFEMDELKDARNKNGLYTEECLKLINVLIQG